MSRVSKRYAKALFSLAIEEKKLDSVADDLNVINDLTKSNQDFVGFISNPLITSGKQLEVVKSLFSNKLNDLTLNFLCLLSEKRRLNLLPEILQKFDVLILVYRNQVRADIISADTLDKEQLKQIQDNIELLTKKSVLLNTRQDKTLIGGFTVKIEDIIIDNSIRYQLSKLKEKLIS
ncbi:MAG: ATP synthase F1 subunit delta [Calditrichaeota bacterium]|nr:ATP synthase F1 subunit delta [Calditrichota bacterium]